MQGLPSFVVNDRPLVIGYIAEEGFVDRAGLGDTLAAELPPVMG